MKIFFTFIVSVAVVFFGFLYYVDSATTISDFSIRGIPNVDFGSKKIPDWYVPPDTVEIKVDLIPIGRLTLDLNNPTRPGGRDTLRFITGVPFWTQVCIRFDNDETLVMNTRRYEQNEIALLKNVSVQSEKNMRMWFVLDSLRSRLVWREVYRDNAVRSNVPLSDVELMRYKFLLKRSPPVF